MDKLVKSKENKEYHYFWRIFKKILRNVNDDFYPTVLQLYLRSVEYADFDRGWQRNRLYYKKLMKLFHRVWKHVFKEKIKTIICNLYTLN